MEYPSFFCIGDQQGLRSCVDIGALTVKPTVIHRHVAHERNRTASSLAPFQGDLRELLIGEEGGAVVAKRTAMQRGLLGVIRNYLT